MSDSAARGTTSSTEDGVSLLKVRDIAFVVWLRENHRGGYIKAFRQLARTQTLEWAELEDLVAIFSNLRANPDEENSENCSGLEKLLSQLSLSQ